MSLTISIRSTIETAETLARNTLDKFYAAWPVANMESRIISIAYNTTVNLLAGTTYLITADPLATIVVGWTYQSHTVEIPLNQFTVISPPATPYLRNTNSSVSTAIPVKVITFS